MGSKCLPEGCAHYASQNGPLLGQLPHEGTLDLPTLRVIYQIIIRNPGYPNQFPYIDSWLQVAQTVSSCV
jgi:hypothetical protein